MRDHEARNGCGRGTYLVHVTDISGMASTLQVMAESTAIAEAIAKETIDPASTILLVEKGTARPGEREPRT